MSEEVASSDAPGRGALCGNHNPTMTGVTCGLRLNGSGTHLGNEPDHEGPNEITWKGTGPQDPPDPYA